MKKLIPLMVGMALTFGAVTAFGNPSSKATTAKSTKPAKAKATKAK